MKVIFLRLNQQIITGDHIDKYLCCLSNMEILKGAWKDIFFYLMRKSIFKIIKGQDFSDTTPKAQYIFFKKDKFSLIRIKYDAVRRMKRKAFDREKIFANCISNRRLVSRLHKEYSKLNNQKKNRPIQKNGQKIWTDSSPKKTYGRMAN